MPLPPTEFVLDLFRQDVLPAAGGSAFILALFLCLGRWAGALGSAAGILVAFVCANFAFPEHGTPITWDNTHRLLPWIPGRSTFEFLPRAALALVAVGLVSRWLGMLVGHFLPARRWWVGNLLMWALRFFGVAVLVVGSGLIPAPMAEANAWLTPALGAAMLFSWIALDGAARSSSSGAISFYLAAVFLAASVVFIYAHSMRFLEIAIVLGYAFLGIAAVARIARVDASGAIPAAVGFLPALVLNVRYQTESTVPLAAFVLIALAPLTLLPKLIPRVARKNPWVVVPLRAIVVFAPLVLAVMLAMEYEQLPPEEDW